MSLLSTLLIGVVVLVALHNAQVEQVEEDPYGSYFRSRLAAKRSQEDDEEAKYNAFIQKIRAQNEEEARERHAMYVQMPAVKHQKRAANISKEEKQRMYEEFLDIVERQQEEEDRKKYGGF